MISYSMTLQVSKFTSQSLRLKSVLKNYCLKHYKRSSIWFILTNLELILFDQLVNYVISTGLGSEEICKV